MTSCCLKGRGWGREGERRKVPFNVFGEGSGVSLAVGIGCV